MIKVPTVHLNGTSKDELLRPLAAANVALMSAIRTVADTAPNARDYYVQNDGAFTIARDEHEARMNALRKVRGELEGIYIAIDEQGKR